MTRKLFLVCSALVLSGWASQSQAALVNWNIDSSQSYIRLGLPANTTTLSVAQIRIRGSGGANPGNPGPALGDTNGGRAFMGGLLATDYNDNTGAFSYLTGQHTAYAIETGNYRPNPVEFNSDLSNANYEDGQYHLPGNPNAITTNTNGGTAPAAFAAKLSINAPLVANNLPLGYLALRNVLYDADGALTLSGGGGNFTGTGGLFGIQSAFADIDGFNHTILGNAIVIPDLQNEAFNLGSTVANTGGITITNLGGLDRMLDQNVNIAVSIDFEGVPLNITVTGRIVAYATVPEPASLSLVGVALSALALRRRRRA